MINEICNLIPDYIKWTTNCYVCTVFLRMMFTLSLQYTNKLYIILCSLCSMCSIAWPRCYFPHILRILYIYINFFVGWNVGIIDGGFHPGKMVWIQGTVLPAANRYLSLFFVCYVVNIFCYGCVLITACRNETKKARCPFQSWFSVS